MLEAPQPSHAQAEDSLIAKPNVPMEECAAALDAAPTLLESTGAAGNDQCNNSSNSDGGSLQPQAADNALAPAPLLVEETTTPLPAAELKPARRLTRSLLKNKQDKEDSAASRSQMTPDDSKEASFDLALLVEKPQRRFTRSLLKTNVESSSVGSDDVHDSASDSPPSVKKMEMKMSKKVACLTKHPGNIRELLNTGLLEGMPVMYIIPYSKVGMRESAVMFYEQFF